MQRRCPCEIWCYCGLILAWAGWVAGCAPAMAAPPPKPAQSDPAASHWAYRPPVRAPLPPVRDRNWPRNSIDLFVLARLEHEGLRPSPEAERAALIRRVTLDLTGLPPQLDEVQAFERDNSPDAYERLVDRLLASPHFGEHWGRHWLDLARYSDTNGYANDAPRDIWPYRDWVIAAYNRDLPFDQFSIEQLAGDLLPNANDAQRIATGFHRNTLFNGEGGALPEEFRVEAVVDRVETTGAVWLASTVGCARCHDHPHDPFSQREFFQLFAFFNSTADTGGGLLVPPEPFLYLPTPDQQRELDAVRSRATERKLELGAAGQRATGDPELARLRDRERELLAGQRKTMVMRELPEPRATHVLERGDFLQPREAVSRGTPQVLPPLPRAATATRLELARWLVAPENPLAARAAVNRTWERLFGVGLVATVDDFGSNGERPSHPELLDWLAREYADRGWSTKSLLRLIVTSATYRQASALSPELLARDPENRLLARGPRLRLEAETIRDVAQAAAGLLDERIGGPSVFPPQPPGLWNDFDSVITNTLVWHDSVDGDRHRRGVYTFWRRSIPHPAMTNFDAPLRQICVARRQRTTTPQQALTTLNDPAFAEAAVALGRRMQAAPGDSAQQLAFGFRLCATRTPRAAELVELTKLYRDTLAELTARPEEKPPVTQHPGEPLLRPTGAEETAWTIVASVLLNLDATLNKW